MPTASGLRRRILRALIRVTVRRQLARATDPAVARAQFLRSVRWLLPDPPRAVFLPDRPGGVASLWAWLAGGDAARAQSGPEGGARAPGVLLYVHGGAFALGSPRTHRALAARLAGAAGMRALLPHYRRAPEHPFPAALEDALAVYEALLARGYPAGRMALAGDSAGGGLALSLAAEIGRRGLPAPAALVAFSPVVDLTFSGASWQENRDSDPMLPSHRGPDMAAMWLQGADPRDPRASPLFADWAVPPPPALLYAAETELLRDDARRMAERLRAAGGRAEARIAGDLPHVWPFLCPWLREGCATIAEAGAFLAAARQGASQEPHDGCCVGTPRSPGAAQPRSASGAPTSR